MSVVVAYPTLEGLIEQCEHAAEADQRARQQAVSITARGNGAVCILDLQGRLTLERGVAELRQTVRALLEQGKTRILLSYNLAYIDSAGLAELVNTYVTARNHGGTVKIVDPEKRIGPRATALALLLAIFEIYEEEAPALASFRASR